MMDFCPGNSSLSDITVGHITRCFLDTLTTPLLLASILVAGVHQLRLYRRFSTPLDTFHLPPSSCLYFFQLLLHILLPFLGIAIFLLHYLGYVHSITGVDILCLSSSVLTWPLAGWLLFLERNRQLPIAPLQGHGPVLLIFWTLAFIQSNVRLITITKEPWYSNLSGGMEIADLVLYVVHYTASFLVFMLGLRAPGVPIAQHYSNMNTTQRYPDSASEGSTWRGLWKKIGIVLPYMWPKSSPLLQLRLLFCIILLISVRVVNVYVPIYEKNIVDSLMQGGAVWPWVLVLIWMGLKLLQGGGTGGQGLLNNLRQFLWIKIQQFTTREVQLGLFNHLHSLSLKWHLGRKTGEVLRVVDRGTSSINSLLQYTVFNILPTFIDILVAVVYFGVTFNIWFGVIVLVTMILYLVLTFVVTEWRTKFRRKMNLADNEQRTKAVDSLLNAETVKYYSMERWEGDRYKEAILAYQTQEWKSTATMYLLNVNQSVIINGGLLATSLYAAWLVSNDKEGMTIGSFVLLGRYMMQLMAPLNWMGTLYRAIQESFVNMENMLDLLNEEVEVVDRPSAVSLPKSAAPPAIQFQNVTFGYKENLPVLDKISFTIKAGTTTAIVGASGAGKTTISKLIFRLYDISEGAILYDETDIRDLTQESLRASIGVVPQDTVLFNDTIRYNIRYGSITASDADVEEAAKLADIHDTITAFPDGYDTVVGERGLKLSGGEKQRVAIARTVLKNPSVLLLDEATSALDTNTERHIQSAMSVVCKDRTTLIVAHRLSTVVGADQILVLSGGDIMEAGTHRQLLEMGGRYALLWNQQASEASEDSEKEEVSQDAIEPEDQAK